MLKLHKRECHVNLTPSDNSHYVISSWGIKSQDMMRIPSWDLVDLWYQIGELLDVDRDDARYLLEQKFWKKEE